MNNTCKWHLCSNQKTKRSNFCSRKCSLKFCVDRRRKQLKQLAVEYKGGSCEKCGYNKCIGALQFHHVNGKKEFGIGHKGYTRSWDVVKNELDKCVLLCSNCHFEQHSNQLS